VKISNVMLESEHGPAHLVDFGFSCRLETLRGRHGSIAGTAGYLAPELFDPRGHRDFRRADNYAAGIVFYNMTSTKPAFRGETVEEVLNANKAGLIDYGSMERVVGESAVQLCRGLSNIDPTARPTSAIALKAPWFRTEPTELRGYPPSMESKRYMLQMRGTEDLKQGTVDSDSGSDGASGSAESEGATDAVRSGRTLGLIQSQYARDTSGSASTANSPGTTVSAGPTLGLERREEPEGSPWRSSVSQRSEQTYAGPWGAAARRRTKGEMGSEGRERQGGGGKGRQWGDMIHGGILESLRSPRARPER
jgi:serine/threonine protein kinase